MFKEIQIGENKVPMKANAATGIRYKQVFGKELFKQMEMINDTDAFVPTDVIMELAYIMAMSGSDADMTRLNTETYMEWLEGFEFMDFMNEETSKEIMLIWQGNKKQSVEPKKDSDQQTEN